MIVEHPGPPGPFGFAEYIGWWALSLAISIASANLIRRYRKGGPYRYAFLLCSIGVPITFGLLLAADISPDTAVGVKRNVEYIMQFVGAASLGLLIAYLLWIGWRSSRT